MLSHQLCFQAIHGFRETQISDWSLESKAIIDRIHETAFTEENPPMGHVHVLDIEKNGYIKPHIDSVRVCVHRSFLFAFSFSELHNFVTILHLVCVNKSCIIIGTRCIVCNVYYV